MINKEELISFEQEVAAAFNAGKIRAPVHLNGGSEDQLIEIFKRVKPCDYVFATWRSHYHALLHGVPREEVMSKVLRGESITLQFPERRFYTSAICGGIPPIAMGVAWAIKNGTCERCTGWTKAMNRSPYDKCPECGSSSDERLAHVWCFVGDMAAEQGSFSEAQQYAQNFGLPITFVIEDNSKCVNTPTREVWGYKGPRQFTERIGPNVLHYSYKLAWPHMGTGKYVVFPDGDGPKHGGM